MLDNTNIAKSVLKRWVDTYGPELAQKMALEGLPEEQIKQEWHKQLETMNQELLAERTALLKTLDTVRQLQKGELTYGDIVEDSRKALGLT